MNFPLYVHIFPNLLDCADSFWLTGGLAAICAAILTKEPTAAKWFAVNIYFFLNWCISCNQIWRISCNQIWRIFCNQIWRISCNQIWRVFSERVRGFSWYFQRYCIEFSTEILTTFKGFCTIKMHVGIPDHWEHGRVSFYTQAQRFKALKDWLTVTFNTILIKLAK